MFGGEFTDWIIYILKRELSGDCVLAKAMALAVVDRLGFFGFSFPTKMVFTKNSFELIS